MLSVRRLLATAAIMGAFLACASDDEPTPSTGAGGAGGDGGMGGAAGAGGGGAAGGASGRWDCLGSVVAPSPLGSSFDLTLTLRDYTSGDDIAGATLQACARGDEPCASPIVTTTTDATGRGTLEIPTPGAAFDGFFSTEGGGIVPQLLFYPLPLAEPPAGFTVRLVFSPSGLADEAAALGTSLDPSRAVFIYRAVDCNGEQAENVVVEADVADEQTTTAYEAAGALSATHTATDSSGFGALFNVPAGAPVTVSYRLTEGQAIGSVQLFVRAGGVTSCPLAPNP